VLIVGPEDDGLDPHALAARGVHAVRGGPTGAVLEHEDPGFDAVVLLLTGSLEEGAELCRTIVAAHPAAALVAVGPFANEQGTGVLLPAGADEFLAAPVELDDLVQAIGAALLRLTLARPGPRAAPRTGLRASPWGLIGESPAMQDVHAIIERVACSDSTVLVSGETGTGKELAARALHERSQRRGDFVAVNCAGLPETLLESELFGHARGAFTDAKSARPGLFLVARNGTLFLDEIAETTPGLQAKLLRALQERTLRPLGADREQSFDARVVVATNRELEREVAQGRFRADLYYRVQVIQLRLPPLRARGGDSLLLARHFLAALAARTAIPRRDFTPTAEKRLLAYPWPGNVRELQNAIERAVAMGGRLIDAGDLPERVRRHRCALPETPPETPLLTLSELERRHVREVMAIVGGRRSEAARILGIDRKTLYRKLVQYELHERRRDSGAYPAARPRTDALPPNPASRRSRAKGE